MTTANQPHKCLHPDCPVILIDYKRKRCPSHAAESIAEHNAECHRRRREALGYRHYICALPGCGKPSRINMPGSCCCNKHSQQYSNNQAQKARKASKKIVSCKCGECGLEFVPRTNLQVYAPDCPNHRAIANKRNRERCRVKYQAHPRVRAVVVAALKVEPVKPAPQKADVRKFETRKGPKPLICQPGIERVIRQAWERADAGERAFIAANNQDIFGGAA